MSRARKSSSSASVADAPGACVPTAALLPIVRSRLPRSVPLMPDEAMTLDQLLGAEIAKLFEEE